MLSLKKDLNLIFCQCLCVFFAAFPLYAQPEPATIQPSTALADQTIDAAEKAIRKDDQLKRCSEQNAKLDAKTLQNASPKKRALAYALQADCLGRKAWLQPTDEKKIAAFKKALDKAKTSIKYDNKCAYCTFQVGAQIGGWARSHGMLKGAMYVGEIREYFNKAKALDPNFLPAILSLATIDAQLPSWLGGDPAGAKNILANIVQKHPKHTYARAQLATVLLALNEEVEAKKHAQQVLAEKNPMMPASHQRTALQTARKVLAD